MILLHGTCVAIDGRGILLRGPSGSGKSDLALRLMDCGAVLVADDQTRLERVDDALLASPPDTLAGLMEVRGLGLVRFSHLERVPLDLVIDLTPSSQVERLPEPNTLEFLGLMVRHMHLASLEASAAAKVRLAMRTGTRDIMLL
jgi:HPr kinase/phosphorylase